MAAPIRYDFPACKLLFEKSSLLNVNSRHGKHIDSHFFNYAVRYLYINYEAVERLSWCDGSSDRSLMVDPFSIFSLQPVLHDWCNKGRGMCYHVCGMVHIKRSLVANRKE